MLGRERRIALLAEGSFTPADAKTAVGVLRWRPEEVVAVIDSTRAGRTTQDCVGIGGAVPVVRSLEQAAELQADTLLIGIAPTGGGLPASWRLVVAEALMRGWDVLSGLHQFLSDDPELATLAESCGCRIHDVRRPPATRAIAARRAGSLEAMVVLTVGSDCNVGKMTTSLALKEDLEARGLRARFVATGQTGIFIADSGAAIDAIPSDFVAGVVEELVIEAARDADIVLVEGQGSIHHPGYSGVSLSLLHGSCPDAMVLCHQAGRTHIHVAHAAPSPRIKALSEIIRDHERAAGWLQPARVLGIALNTLTLDEAEARRAVEHAGHLTGLPVTDPVRFGTESVANAIVWRMEERRRRATAS